MNIPDALIYPLRRFADEFLRHVHAGESTLHEAEVVFVGLARNCATWLRHNLNRLELVADQCRSWKLHIETNDNEDDTDQVLADFCAAHRQATFTSQRLGRRQYAAEFAGPRTQALAEYRTSCQQWVRENAPHADFVCVIDWDQWGGWSHNGFLHGVGRLVKTPGACGMASVSLIESQQMIIGSGGQPTAEPAWMHYDAWALRLNSPWDDYTAGMGAWKHLWLPAVGSPPIPVVSAFGGMAVYDTHAYLKGVYDGADCEHVAFHVSMAERTGQRLYLEPGMRTVMHWLEGGTDATGKHGND